MNEPSRRSAGRADGGGSGVAEAETVTITTSELANVEITVDIFQGDRDNGPVANADELAAERPDAAVHVVEGTDHSSNGGDRGDETIERTLELFALPVGER